MNPATQKILADFYQVVALSGVALGENDITAERLSAPHCPPAKLPTGKMAVYAFFLGGQCLKVGKVGPRSQARYTSQHYNPESCRSNLAKSVIAHQGKLGLGDLDENSIKGWIERNTDRINFVVDAKVGMPILNLLEAFLQCRFRPRFEGFETQKQ